METKKPAAGTLADLAAHASAPERGSERSFGLVFAAVFAIVGLWPLWMNGAPRYWAIVAATVFLMLAFLVPRVLAPLNRLWMQVGLLLGRIVSPIVLLLLFVVAVIPTGLILRLVGKDPLQRRFEPQLDTYWIRRQPPARPDAGMKNQF